MADPSLSERMAKLRSLSLLRNQARKQNHEEVVEEDRRNNLPDNFEARKRRAEYILEEDKARAEAAASGADYDREKWLEMSADKVDQLWRAKQRKKNPDTGFSDYEQATVRQYDRLTKNMKVDMGEYAKEKQQLGEEAFYPTANTLIIGKHKDSPEAIDRMCSDLARIEQKRSKYHRRRPYDADGQIDYINDRNMKFNQKIERFYGKYTKEIKQDLERGTAV